MKKELLTIMSVICAIHETTAHRVSVDTFASCDVVEFRIYVDGYEEDKEYIILSYPSMSILSIQGMLLEVLNHGKEIAA